MKQQTESDVVWNMGEAYKKELADIHAPAELITLTKERAAAEEKKQKRHKRYKSVYLPAAVAAAVLLLVFSFPMWNRISEKKGQESVQPYLGSTEEMPKSAGETEKPEEVMLLQKKTVLPMGFLKEDAWTEELEGTQVKFVQEGDTCIAAYAEENGYMVVSMKTKDLDGFREAVRRLLQNGGNIYEDRK